MQQSNIQCSWSSQMWQIQAQNSLANVYTQLQVALTALMHSHTLHRQRRYGVNLESYIPSFHLSSSPFTFGHLKPRSLRETQFWGHLSACLVSRPSHLEIEIFNGFSHFRLFKTCLRDSVEDHHLPSLILIINESCSWALIGSFISSHFKALIRWHEGGYVPKRSYEHILTQFEE